MQKIYKQTVLKQILKIYICNNLYYQWCICTAVEPHSWCWASACNHGSKCSLHGLVLQHTYHSYTYKREVVFKYCSLKRGGGSNWSGPLRWLKTKKVIWAYFHLDLCIHTIAWYATCNNLAGFIYAFIIIYQLVLPTLGDGCGRGAPAPDGWGWRGRAAGSNLNGCKSEADAPISTSSSSSSFEPAEEACALCSLSLSDMFNELLVFLGWLTPWHKTVLLGTGRWVAQLWRLPKIPIYASVCVMGTILMKWVYMVCWYA